MQHPAEEKILARDFGLERRVAELHRFQNDIFDGSSGGNHGENVFGVGNHYVEDVGRFRGKKSLQGGPNFFRFCDPFGGHAKALADGKIIRKDFLGVFWVA